MERRTFLKMTAAAATATLQAQGQSPAKRRGIQAVGLANFASADIKLLASAIKLISGRLEISYLPFNFHPGAPFSNIQTAIDLVRDMSGLDLTITTCLDFKDSTSYQMNGDPFKGGFKWPMFVSGAASDSNREGYLKNIGWLDRLDNYVPFVNRERDRTNKTAVHHLLIPMLEDNCPSAGQYSRLLNVIMNYLDRKHSGFTVQYRRSGLPSNKFRVGNLPIELHGLTIPSELIPGDVWSPDGDAIAVDQFIDQQHHGLKNGVSCLYWRDELNGRDVYADSVVPSARVNLTPLSKNDKLVYSELLKCWASK